MPQLRRILKCLELRYLALGFAIALMLYLAMIPVRLMLVRASVPTGQAIFVLGGGRDREAFAAGLARRHPGLDVWVSTGSAPEVVAGFFKEEGVPLARLHLDYRAVDTVTNFTTMVGVFRQLGIEHVYLVTSDFHMRRARAIAFLVFGSQGIVCTTVEIPCNFTEVPPKCLAESTIHVLRDVVRSLLWLVTKMN